MKYEIVKLFIGGFLKGLTYTEKTDIQFNINQIVSKPCGGSPYKIVSVKEI
jgi:hypothetical protein